MKNFFVKIKYKYKPSRKILNLLIDEIKKINCKNLAIFYSIQYELIAREIFKFLKNKFKILAFKQVVGCNIKLFDVDAYICVSDGYFHGLSIIKKQINNLFFKYKSFDIAYYIKPVFIINKEFKKIDETEINKQINDLKARWLNFNRAKNYGIIVSVKPGQENFDLALKIKEEIERTNKKAFLFLCNDIRLNEFDNFDIDFFIITACPQFSIERNKKLCNIEEFFIFKKLKAA
ncbi:MAG: diphthamide synthesis protein [Candidatus Pacearchaeota archaeon]